MKKLEGLLGGLAVPVLSGLMAILPASQVSCTNTRQVVCKEHSPAYDFAQKLTRENPKSFEKVYESDSTIYQDSGLKLGKVLFAEAVPTTGKGRFITIRNDGSINAGYWGDKTKVTAFSYNPKDNQVIIAEGDTITYLKRINDIWEKGVYSGSVPEGIKFEEIPFKKSKANQDEVEKWMEVVRNLIEKYK